MFEPHDRSDMETAIWWLWKWQEFGPRVGRLLLAGNTAADFQLRSLMGLLYKDYLSPARQVEFVQLFRTVPTVTRAFVELERGRAWGRRRHLVEMYNIS